MGGNALRHLDPQRLSSVQVINLVQYMQRIWQIPHDTPFHLVPWVAEKQDHGDVDLVCEVTPAEVVDFAQRIGVDPARIVCNDRVLSVPVELPWDRAKIAQVDFITCTPKEGPSFRFFYSGGDFGMYLGRLAAWYGLVFGMDGLRYRADPKYAWATDVHLTSDPATILHVLGYLTTLPYFDTYETLWQFVMSSQMAHPYVFMPESTNAENRSRDKQRRKVGDFQDWLRSTYPDSTGAPWPKPTPEDAQEWVRCYFPKINLPSIILSQMAASDYGKRVNYLLGVGAVEDVIGPRHSSEVVGDIVRRMLANLPPRHQRMAAMATEEGWRSTITEARMAAMHVALMKQIPLLGATPKIPSFEPRP
jgi:hypothetical protein